jgi:hypothetical protein
MKGFLLGLGLGCGLAALVASSPADAGAPLSMKAALKSARLDLISLEIERARVLDRSFAHCHLKLIPRGDPVLPGELQAGTADLRSALEDLLDVEIVQIVLDVYAKDIWTNKSGDWGVIRQGGGSFRRSAREDSDALRGPDMENAIDLQQAVSWYGRALWGRPIASYKKGDTPRKVTQVLPWSFRAWECPLNLLEDEQRPKGGALPRALPK